MISSFALLVTLAAAPAASSVEDEFPDRFSVMAGLMQWTVFGGGNLAVQLELGRLIFEYSHGQALELSRFDLALTEAERNQDLQLRMPWTTGFGVGFQFTENFHALVEFKAHRYQVRLPNSGAELSYSTFSIGPALFYDLHLYKGLFLQPSLRWWPTIAHTMDSGDMRRADGGIYTHEPHNLNVFANVSLGLNL